MDSGSQTDNTPDSIPCLIHFDSGKRFKSHSAGGVFRVIRKYFHACYEATKGTQYPGRSVDAKSIPGISPDLPQQGNAEDCGVYMLEFMERLLMNPSSIDRKAIISMEKNNGKVPANFWFTAEVASQKRESIDCLISTLAKENGGTDTSK
jgi:Ulp1 family protease